ncbi:MAG: hypothetical protein WC455_10060 [Dehalococcoidia bacterium]|jgi:hypothetical protein
MANRNQVQVGQRTYVPTRGGCSTESLMLMETGDTILLESGDSLIMED